MEDIAKDILIRASQGDMQAFEDVYKASSSFVYNVALRVVNNREDALEVAQEVFMIIYHKLKSFRFESSFKTWVYRITANYAINFAKKSSRAKTVPYEDLLERGRGSSSEAQTQMDQEHQSQLVENFLGELNPDQRACVVLRDIQGLSYEEIAQALNININTVRSRLKRSREKLLSLRKQVDMDESGFPLSGNDSAGNYGEEREFMTKFKKFYWGFSGLYSCGFVFGARRECSGG